MGKQHSLSAGFWHHHLGPDAEGLVLYVRGSAFGDAHQARIVGELVTPAGQTGWSAVRHVMVLPIPGRVVSVLLQNLGERSVALRRQRIVAGEARGQFRDDAGVGLWWLRPLNSAARVGEQSAVV